MSANRGKDTGPEVALRRALWDAGIRGYRKNWKKAPGRPDIAFPGKKIAIFVHGCYWHGCPVCNFPLPKHNRNFWKEKFERNKKRDVAKVNALKKAGWRVVVVWEHQVRVSSKNVFGVIRRLAND